MKFSSSSLLALCMLQNAGLVSSEFTAISTEVPQDIDGVTLPTFCSKRNKVPKVMHTIEPSETDEVVVLTDPADLVTAVMDGSSLGLRWNLAVSDGADGGGIIIQVPSGKLATVSACCSAVGQIMPGFNGPLSLEVSSGANLIALMGGVNGTMGTVIDQVEVSSSAIAQVSGASPITSLEVSSGGTVSVNGDVETLDASSSASVTIEGEISGASEVSSGATVSIKGDVATLDASSSASVTIQGEIAGASEATSGSTITTSGSCDTVETNSGGECVPSADISDISVVVSEGDLIGEGTGTCSTISVVSGAASLLASSSMFWMLGSAAMATATLASLF